MRPDRMGLSKWVKLRPWYYTPKRKQARREAECMAILEDMVAAIGEENIRRGIRAIAATGITTAEACANVEAWMKP